MDDPMFEIGAKVKIKLNAMAGEVNAIWITRTEIQYEIKYCDNTGKVNESWFREHELE